MPGELPVGGNVWVYVRRSQGSAPWRVLVTDWRLQETVLIQYNPRLYIKYGVATMTSPLGFVAEGCGCHQLGFLKPDVTRKGSIRVTIQTLPLPKASWSTLFNTEIIWNFEKSHQWHHDSNAPSYFFCCLTFCPIGWQGSGRQPSVLWLSHAVAVRLGEERV